MVKEPQLSNEDNTVVDDADSAQPQASEAAKLRVAVCVKGLDFYEDRTLELLEWLQLQFAMGADSVTLYIYHLPERTQRMLKEVQKDQNLELVSENCRFMLMFMYLCSCCCCCSCSCADSFGPAGQREQFGRATARLHLEGRLAEASERADPLQRLLLPVRPFAVVDHLVVDNLLHIFLNIPNLFSYSHSHDYVLLVDTDEVLVPLRHDSWQAMIAEFVQGFRQNATSLSARNVFKFPAPGDGPGLLGRRNRAEGVQERGISGKSFIRRV